MRLYLSGPMTDRPNKNYDAFMAAAQQLRDAGHGVINPWELDQSQPVGTWEECLKRDIRYEMNCEAVAVLPGWKKSKGASLEVYIAKALGWPVHPVNYYLKKETVNANL